MPRHSPLTIRSFPKVNLALDILGKDPSGYHIIQTVFHQLEKPFDELVFEPREDGKIIIESDNPKLPMDRTNTVFKAAMLLKKHSSVSAGARVFIKKRIPLMSGLGGGASNAVAAIKGLAELWGVPCCVVLRESSRARLFIKTHAASCFLLRLASQIGMDCAFFFRGGTALGEHFGERITPLPALPRDIHFEMIDTGVKISSHWAYQHVDIRFCGKNVDKTEKLVAAIRAGDSREIFRNLHNDFEQGVFEEKPELRKMKEELESQKSEGRILLCGSGGCLVRVFQRFPRACAQALIYLPAL